MEVIRQSASHELTRRILPFWMERMEDPRGGFYGRIDGTGQLDRDACKGAVLNARILWTFASAFRILGDRKYLDTALRAADFMRKHFLDKEFGGVFWSLNADASPLETKKQYYAIAFAIYGFAELYRATGDGDALDTAISLYRDIEAHSLDRGGYSEASARDWKPIEDVRLSEKDQNDARTMNTHLHILEAYTALYRVWKDEGLAASLKGLIRIFLDRIILENGHMGLFFDEDWHLNSSVVSYGHDIEASWLLIEAAEVLGDDGLKEIAGTASRKMACAAMEGFSADGGMKNEFDPVRPGINPPRDWWVQAETVTGCLHQYKLTGSPVWLEHAKEEWDFIMKNISCPDGEWYWAALPDGNGFRPELAEDRAGFWKCPYHNGRMCLEIIENLDDSVL